MKKILLATDLAANSDRAMERALKIAKEQKAKLQIIHIAPSYTGPKTKKHALNLQKDIEGLIRSYLDNYKDAADVKAVITVKQGGEAFFQILESAYADKADLIVMGMHGKEKFRDLFIGTTIERVIRKGVTPVLMVKNKPTNGYQSVVSAIDFAPASRTAMRTAMEIAPRADFCAAHVYSLPAYDADAFIYVHTQEVTEASQKKMMHAFLKTERSYFAKTHHGDEKKLSGTLVEGAVDYKLRSKVKSLKADLITIGVHGQPTLMPKLGGTAAGILSKPPCDVLVAPE